MEIRKRFYWACNKGTKTTLPEEIRQDVITGEATLHEVLNTKKAASGQGHRHGTALGH